MPERRDGDVRVRHSPRVRAASSVNGAPRAAEMKISLRQRPVAVEVMVSTCMSSVSALHAAAYNAVLPRRCRLIRRAISRGDTSHGFGDAARKTPRKISMPPRYSRFPSQIEARSCDNNAEDKWTVEERNFSGDYPAPPYDCYTALYHRRGEETNTMRSFGEDIQTFHRNIYHR